MASSSSPSPRTWNVFTSFHGPDVRKTLLSHLCKQFSDNGITMFDDNGIDKGQTIGPALIEAIRESRISIIVLSKNYASSSWCLDELLEILKCKEGIGQIVMTVFYGVDPSDVRKQTGDFGIAFNKTCALKTEEQRGKWSQALTYVGNIAGEDFKNWAKEAEMIVKIASDVSDKLNATPSRDFDDMVGLDDHLKEMESLLDLDNAGVKIVGISGPAGIGKSTIARALHSRLSNRYQHTCFMDNLRENYKTGRDEYGRKLRLHEHLLSKILNLTSIRIRHLGVIQERLRDKKVLIILDDVESLDQLKALANIGWYGPGSRVIVTTENEEILEQHGINVIYDVGFPSKRAARTIFCLSAFEQTSPPEGFRELTKKVVNICGNLPLGLHVLGLSLRRKSLADWNAELPRLENRLDGRIESVLKVGYESLYEKDQTLFLLIAVFLNYKHVDYVTSMLENTNFLDVSLGLKSLANRNLIHIDNERVVMHRLLQVMAREVISRQKLSKRKILEDPYDISKRKGKRSTLAISFDVADIKELKISKRDFIRMCNLLILKVYNGRHHPERQLHVPEEMEFPPSLRLLHWEAYPRTSFRFCPENLVTLKMENSQLKKLWGGTQPLANLKEMILRGSSCLKELPDLSNATNLERLDVSECNVLVEIPSSISNLHKICELWVDNCPSLEVIPTLIHLASLKGFFIVGCPRLRSFPDVPTSLKHYSIADTSLEELPASFRHYSGLKRLYISGGEVLKTFSTHLPTSITELHIRNSGIESITTDCIKDLHNLTYLNLSNCQRLVSLPELPGTLRGLSVANCTSLERVSGPLNTPNAQLYFTNCIKLSRQARQSIIQQSYVLGFTVLPGKEVPAEFNYRAKGNSITIPHSSFNRFKVCLVVSRSRKAEKFYRYYCRDIDNSVKSCCINFTRMILYADVSFESHHLLIFSFILPLKDLSEMSRKIELGFDSDDIIELGVQILTDETDQSNNGGYDPLWDTFEYESGEASEKEDDEEGYKSESGETSEDKDEDIADEGVYESISRKRPRTTMITDLKWGIKKRRS